MENSFQEIEVNIMQVLYLSKGTGLSSSKIAHLMPKKMASKKLIELYLINMVNQNLVEYRNEKLSIERHGLNVHVTCNDSSRTFPTNETGNNSEILNISHCTYLLSAKGIEYFEKGLISGNSK